MLGFSAYPLDLVVLNTQYLTAEIKAISLVAADGSDLPSFTAGAHIRVCVQTKNDTQEGEGSNYRSYSLINSTQQQDCYELAIKLETQGGGGSRFMHGLQIGDRIKASLPRNDFELSEQEHEAVLIAGGIGITPILSMTHALCKNNKTYALHYAARSPESMAYRQQVQELCGSHARLYFDQGDPSLGLSVVQALGAPAANKHVYVCGPKVLIDAVINAAQSLQWPSSHVHFELFTAPAPQEQDHAFKVVFERSQLTLDIAKEQSILSAMIEAGMDPMFDCERGECGVCAVRVVAGAVDHRDYALSDSDHEEDHLMCVCVSRAIGDELVLDA